MRKPKILFLDEPSIGLDPLMREELLKIILEQKALGATIIMSSNSIEELERVSDKVALLNKGKIVDVADMNDIKNKTSRTIKKIILLRRKRLLKFRELGFNIIENSRTI